jgi:hypothetical protein
MHKNKAQIVCGRVDVCEDCFGGVIGCEYVLLIMVPV